MDRYLILCDDWRLLEEKPSVVCRQFEHFTEGVARYFAPVLFAEYSCLTQFVDEEIDLVVSSQQKHNEARLTYDEFIDFWGWRDKLSSKVYHLSGGWRKLLALSFFLNLKSENLLVVDFTSHLSDRLIKFALAQAEQLEVKRMAFAEYDEEIIQQHAGSLRRLKRHAGRLVDIG